MKTEYFDYNLPKELIAQRPSENRENARLMVLDRKSGKTGHYRFYDLPLFLTPGDVLVINNTKVLPARLIGKDKRQREVFLIKHQADKRFWEAMIRPKRGLTEGNIITFKDNSLSAKIRNKTEAGTYIIEFSKEEGLFDKGYMPLPPYIKRDYNEQSPLHQMDRERYQTIYAEHPGAIAAPTAGMHFTEELIAKIKAKGIIIAPVTLHVGLGTFRPVRAESVEEHKMLPEWFSIPDETSEYIKNAKRVIAVGTTSVRSLEDGRKEGYTNIFIYPPYKFKTVNGLITNFHLPKSTLIMLVSAFAGRDFIIKAYEEAVRKRYRFYSYGDAMLIL